MSEREEWERARSEIWRKTQDVRDRIEQLKELTVQYPGQMVLYSDIADSCLKAGDIHSAVATYQKVIDLKDTFDVIWDNHLGKAYLFTGNYGKAIEILEKSRVFDYDQGLFLAFGYLKNGDREKFRWQFDKWVSENMEKAFEHYYYAKYINALFTEEEAKFIEETWDEYYQKYYRMKPYELYCELYKQYYLKPELETHPADKDSGIPPKLTITAFKELKAEYFYLDRKTMFGEPNEADYQRYFDLKELLFADIVF